MGNVIKITPDEVRSAIRLGVQFRWGSLRGVPNATFDPPWYRYKLDELPDHWVKVFQAVKPDYVVTSNWRPIAWHWIEYEGKVPQDRWALPYTIPGEVPGRHITTVREALVFTTPIEHLTDERL